MRLDAYRTLGRSGLRVSPLCLGTMTFGTEWDWGADEVESGAILERYLGAGGNFLDTANIYTKGHSEVIQGMKGAVPHWSWDDYDPLWVVHVPAEGTVTLELRSQRDLSKAAPLAPTGTEGPGPGLP